ncbi:hypothetical protein OROMI_015025 [Orobanche minor]
MEKSEVDEAEFSRFHSNVKRGDIFGVSGFPGKNKRGELSIFPRSFVVLSRCLCMMLRQKAGPDANLKIRRSLITRMFPIVQFFTVVAIGMVLEPPQQETGPTYFYDVEGSWFFNVRRRKGNASLLLLLRSSHVELPDKA